MTQEELLKLTPEKLVDLGVCPRCLDKQTNGGVYGDDTNLKIYEDEDIDCLFVANPRAVGHMMIASKAHYHDLSEAPDEINEKIIRFAKQFMIILKEVYLCDRVYLCTMCDGPMNHYHIQLIPRYSFEKRGSTNFVKERNAYVYDEQKVQTVRQKIADYAKRVDG